jgi:copper oxidase (laccase) domain-containing protein
MVTEAADGDLHPERVDPDVLRRRQIALTGTTWVMLDEVHGVAVFDLDAHSTVAWPLAGVGDIVCGNVVDTAIAVWVADCAPIVLFGANGTSRVVAHAGWRGLAAGVIDVAVDALEATGTTVAAAALGACIHSCCYEFGERDLDDVARGVGAAVDEIAGTTSWGTGALDVPRAVAAGLAGRGILLDAVGSCTGCDQRFRSHRRRRELERHALVAWFEEAS